MPIISKIGARSLKVRLIYTGLFFVLIVGALTMLYPFALMISGSFKSDTDFYNISPYPRFWTDDKVLFQKYAESKYQVVTTECMKSWGVKVGSWRDIEVPEIDAAKQRDLDDFLAWRVEYDFPTTWYKLGHVTGGRLLAHSTRLFRELMYNRFDGDIQRFRDEMGIYADNWSMVECPRDHAGLRRERPLHTGVQAIFQPFKATRPREDWSPINMDATFFVTFTLPKYTDIDNYNKLHGTSYESFDDVVLGTRVPAEGLEREDWEQFVRVEMNPEFIRLNCSEEVSQAYREYLSEKYASIDELNARHETSWGSFDEIPCQELLPETPLGQLDWVGFIADNRTIERDGREVPEFLFESEQLRLYGPRQAFEEYVAKSRSVAVEEVAPLPMPIREADYVDTIANAKALRWEFSTRNYKCVFDYIFLHGRGAINTVIYCSMAILASLLVNPLAAYALSRYKPPSQYTVLLFCMATMSFPTAVVMIPNFLLVKRFPVWQLVGMLVAFFVAIRLLGTFARNMRETLRLVISLGFGLLVGFFLVPTVLARPHISLLNTFAALILPGMANGYFIFLLKGFFDSLPRELYEAADLDGASEWTKFWRITMNLSKPILAVIALGAFTAAYAAFMHAVIIIPDRKMWTIMVWIYQLQSESHPAVQFTSLVIAAIPTFVVFLTCQSVIMRGIVVPTEK